MFSLIASCVLAPARRFALRLLTGLMVLVTVVWTGPGTTATAASAADSTTGHCAREHRVATPGAEHQSTACLPDLTSGALTGTAYTDAADWSSLIARGTENPSGVPGVQVDGYFPDTSHFNTTHGWNHDAQFVIRLPDHWNGGLVVTGAPGVRKQYSLDPVISDWALARGFAYAATDKGNSGADFFTDGTLPGDAIAEWNRRTTQLTVAARAVVAQHYGRAPHRAYMTGMSNGGYLTRWQLENRPGLYDGGVDWEGTLWRADGPNLFSYLPTAVARQLGRAGDDDMIAAGFAPGTEFLWPYHQDAYWGFTQKTYRAEFDPGYDPACPGASAGGSGARILAPCASDADYDYAGRPAAVHRAVARISLTGNIRKPLITLHGTLDALLPIGTDSDVYARMIAREHRGRLHRYYTVEDGTHIDGLQDRYPQRLRPILPCYRAAFDALTAWVETGTAPAPSHLVRRPATGDVVNTCSLR